MTVAARAAERVRRRREAACPTRPSTPTRRRAKRLGRRFAELAPIVATATELERTRADLEAARELAGEDAGFADEADELRAQVETLEDRLRQQLLPKDPNDGKDVILEVKAGEGGDESALFAGDLLRMYTALRRAAGLDRRGARRRADRPRRHQVGHARRPRPQGRARASGRG